MARFVRKLSKKIFIWINLLAVAVFLLACMTGYLTPGRYWYIAVLGVVFPHLLLVLVGFVIFWAGFKSRWFLLSLIALAIGWSQVSRVVGMHPFNGFTLEKKEGTLRVMHWNVARFDQMNVTASGNRNRQGDLDYIRKMNPDIICMAEFLESNNPREIKQNIPYFRDSLHFPYYFFAPDYRRWDGLYMHGVAIFSKYPLLDTQRIRFAGPENAKAGESLIHADADVDGKRIRIFATHLQSLRFDGNDYSVIKDVTNVENGAVNKSKGVLRKFRQAYFLRSKQAEIVKREMDASPYPSVLCADFNDVPNSFTYQKIRGHHHDAFLSAGFGLGRTFSSLSPTLRIDYIFTDPGIDVLQFKKTVLPFSDHYPLVADLRLADAARH